MISFIKWFQQKCDQFSDNIYLLDTEKQITYKELFNNVKHLSTKLSITSSKTHHNIVFMGDGSIEAYQLYFAVLTINAVWVPIDYRLDPSIQANILAKHPPSCILYDKKSIEIEKIGILSNYKCYELTELFSSANNEIDLAHFDRGMKDCIISIYLSSGSSGIPKIVEHGWHATLHHAHATVNRYQFNASSRLFNARQIFHASGAFALPTLLHCGGSIVIPNYLSYKKPTDLCSLDWAEQMVATNVTHASFFPSEMQRYAECVDHNPRLNPLTLKRITTGGEGVELTDLIRVSRALAVNQYWHDNLWTVYPYLGDGYVFAFLISLYEYFYERLVHVTQTYGATELTCNAAANTPISGPDRRGIGSALDSLHAVVIDEEGMSLPRDGKSVGQLVFYGSSIATKYTDDDPSLSPHCFKTNDLASITKNGAITLFGRKENLIRLSNGEMVNPVILEKQIKQITGTENAIIFKLNDQLHAAIQTPATNKQMYISNTIKANENLKLITTISF